MPEKYAYGLWGALVGAIAIVIVGFTWGGWVTAGTATQQAITAAQTALVPSCVKEVMADPTAAAELKVKRTNDFDDVVRDYRKRTSLDDRGGSFNRECGRAIEAQISKTATKS